VKGSIYGFWVKGVEVTDGAEVTKMAKKAKVSEGIQMTARHVIQPIAEKGVWMTTRHVIHLVAEMAEVSDMTARHVMHSLGKVAV
jgi:RNA:NAD 2'-phosphotransferase (TPT1/KptA family)